MSFQLLLKADGKTILDVTDPTLATQTLSGFANGFTLNSLPVFIGSAGLFGANMLGESSIALDMRIAFWDQPFTAIPSAPAVPEPATWMLVAWGSWYWVVYAEPAFGGASAVLRYLGRSTHRVAISHHRLLAFDRTGGIRVRRCDDGYGLRDALAAAGAGVAGHHHAGAPA